MTPTEGDGANLTKLEKCFRPHDINARPANPTNLRRANVQVPQTNGWAKKGVLWKGTQNSATRWGLALKEGAWPEQIFKLTSINALNTQLLFVSQPFYCNLWSLSLILLLHVSFFYLNLFSVMETSVFGALLALRTWLIEKRINFIFSKFWRWLFKASWII